MPPIICHPDYLVKAIDCLLDNAFKFKDKERENNVRLRVSFDGDRHIWFTVSDTGRGIPSSYHDMIFEPFYQINREEHEDQGAGAGLTIVKGVTELHHGDVRMESQVGKGSVFSIVMPIYEE
jgi:signal transduction histidine kinase